jgi:hypothetical protein
LNALLVIASLAVAATASASEAAPGPAVPNRSRAIAELWARAERAELADHPQWHSLLHYEREWFPPRVRSRALGGDFFLSEIGERDARAELRASIEAFLDPDATVKNGEHPQCAFIARRHWLAQELDLKPGELPAVECTAYERWREGLEASGLTLIFPEGFLNSPGSMFGHTLLRIDSKGAGGDSEILGHGVDFTANSDADNPFLAVAKGVSGQYPGFFSVRPYFTLLKRYSDWENRDIWEYPLELDEDQLEFLLMHLWELRGIEFSYFFFTKNCSYELLRLIEVGVGDLHAADRFRGPVIPVDTLRALLAHPGLVSGARYRPSPETQLRAALRSLGKADREAAQAIASGQLDPSDASLQAIPAERRARVLDVAYDQLRYEFLARQVSEDESRGLSMRILVARSRIDALPEEIPRPEIAAPTARPDQGHESSLVALSGGWRDDESFIELRWQPAFHDLIDDDSGFSRHMQVRFLDTRLRIYPQSERVILQRLTLLELTSLSPRSRIFRPVAWRFATGLRSRRVPQGARLDDIYVWRSEFGMGLSFDPTDELLLYGLAHVKLDVGGELDHDVAFGPGGQAGLFVGGAGSRLRGHLFGDVTRYVAGDTTTEIRTGVESRVTVHRNVSIVAEGTYNRAYGDSWFEGILSVNLHF